ncbi:hypothetical protein J1N35_012446 [Gossypium stocksii]|uniref:Uncharacterized protein n=1 Tax=Gossypium stocksii TaxID=47602 RepID=A0A9D3W6A7_9ROSI|nr:hypothetical protein J1N35_012446 [Gossypium stocksii]
MTSNPDFIKAAKELDRPNEGSTMMEGILIFIAAVAATAVAQLLGCSGGRR